MSAAPKSNRERQRDFRRRLSAGIKTYRIEISDSALEDLVDTGELAEHQLDDERAIERALSHVIKKILSA